MTKASYSNITVYAPLQSSYGFLPANKWPDFMPSLIWTASLATLICSSHLLGSCSFKTRNERIIP